MDENKNEYDKMYDEVYNDELVNDFLTIEHMRKSGRDTNLIEETFCEEMKKKDSNHNDKVVVVEEEEEEKKNKMNESQIHTEIEKKQNNFFSSLKMKDHITNKKETYLLYENENIENKNVNENEKELKSKKDNDVCTMEEKDNMKKMSNEKKNEKNINVYKEDPVQNNEKQNEKKQNENVNENIYNFYKNESTPVHTNCINIFETEKSEKNVFISNKENIKLTNKQIEEKNSSSSSSSSSSGYGLFSAQRKERYNVYDNEIFNFTNKENMTTKGITATVNNNNNQNVMNNNNNNNQNVMNKNNNNQNVMNKNNNNPNVMNNNNNNNNTTRTEEQENSNNTKTSNDTNSPIKGNNVTTKSTTENVENKNENKNDSRNTFECNICFDDVRDPVVTKCGHLFCWSCLNSWIKKNNDCPVCKAEVLKENVIPLYGRGTRSNEHSYSNTTEEPRPTPHRKEPTRRTRNGNNNVGLRALGVWVNPFSFALSYTNMSEEPYFSENITENRRVQTETYQAEIASSFFFFLGCFISLYLFFFPS